MGIVWALLVVLVVAVVAHYGFDIEELERKLKEEDDRHDDN